MTRKKVLELREKYADGISSEDVERAADGIMEDKKNLMLRELFDGIESDNRRKEERLHELEDKIGKIIFIMNSYGNSCMEKTLEEKLMGTLEELDRYRQLTKKLYRHTLEKGRMAEGL